MAEIAVTCACGALTTDRINCQQCSEASWQAIRRAMTEHPDRTNTGGGEPTIAAHDRLGGLRMPQPTSIREFQQMQRGESDALVGEDRAGVLIHADGTPMTEDEIAAMEAGEGEDA